MIKKFTYIILILFIGFNTHMLFQLHNKKVVSKEEARILEIENLTKLQLEKKNA